MRQHSLARSLTTASLATLLGLAAQPSFAAADHAHAPAAITAPNAKAAEARQKAYDHTQALMALQKRWANAKGAAKSRALEQLVAKAEERRAYLLELMASNPAEVLRVAIPEEKQMGMPAEVLDKLEQRLETEGELEAIFEDYEDGSHKLRHFVNTPFGERFELHFSGKPSELKSRTPVRLNGVLLENTSEKGINGNVTIEPGEESLINLAADAGSTDSSMLAADLPTNTVGEQRILAIMVNFQDQPDNKPWTADQVRDLVFKQTNDFYLENSAGKTWLEGDVTGWYTLPLDSTVCDNFGVRDRAKEAVSAAGTDLSAYDRFVYLFPKNACNYAGMGEIGVTPSNAWISGQPTLRVLAHELGHNLGLYHAHALECGTSTLGESCNTITYGDTLDVMGSAGTVAHFNAFQKTRLGWLESYITSVDTAGSYRLEPYATAPGTEAKALKIRKGTDPSTGDETWYYVEYRQATGFDSFIADPDDLMDSNNVLNGVVIHSTMPVGFGQTSALLDMTPDSSTFYDWEDPALTVAESFSDTEAGITITTDWTDSSGAQVNVSFGPQDCVHANPDILLTPTQGEWVAAGTAVTYNVRVTNNDGTSCGSSSYNLNASQPSGWSTRFANNVLSLVPGSSATTTLTVTSSSTALDGFYDIPVSAVNGSYSAKASVTYVINNPVLNGAPVAVDDSASTPASTAVTIDVLANDSDPDGDSLSITSISGVSGSTVINADNSITFTPVSGFSGTEVFNYSVSDGNGGSAGANVSITVEAPPPTSNEAPVAMNDSITLTSLGAVNVPVLSNDWDPEGAALQVTAITQGGKGVVTINADGTLTYSPEKRFKSTDSFSYTISDGDKTASATVNVQLGDSTDDSSGGKGGNGKGPNK